MPNSTPAVPPSPDAATLFALAEVKAQLGAITALITSHHASTNQRIDDMRNAVDTRLDGIDKRLERVEGNERATALRTAGISAITSAVFAAGIEGVRRLAGH